MQASAESARVAIRLSRRDARNTLKKLKLHLEKDHEQEIDTCTNKYIKEADALYASKQRDIQNQ